MKPYATGPDCLKLGHTPVLTGSNQTKPAQTDFDRLKAVLTEQTDSTGPDQLKADQTGPGPGHTG